MLSAMDPHGRRAVIQFSPYIAKNAESRNYATDKAQLCASTADTRVAKEKFRCSS